MVKIGEPTLGDLNGPLNGVFCISLCSYFSKFTDLASYYNPGLYKYVANNLQILFKFLLVPIRVTDIHSVPGNAYNFLIDFLLNGRISNQEEDDGFHECR